MRTILLIHIIILCHCRAFCQTYKDILDYYAKVPQEKLFVHTDKDYYIAGDTMWFRIHTIDAATNRPICRSKFVYLELHDNNGSLVNRIKIKADSDSVFANMMPIDSSLPANNYTLYAYTQWMTNFDSDMFFKKQIHIVDSTTVNHIERKDEPSRHLSLYVMPEGGNLIAGKRQRVAYKVIDEHEHGVDVKVCLKNQHGEKLQEGLSQHLGMGYIVVNATPSDSLTLEAMDLKGNICSTLLPKALDNEAALQVMQRNGVMTIEVIKTDGISLADCSIVLYGAGNLLTFKMNEQNSNVVRLATSELFPGVVNITLADNIRHSILSERLVFINNMDTTVRYSK